MSFESQFDGDAPREPVWRSDREPLSPEAVDEYLARSEPAEPTQDIDEPLPRLRRRLWLPIVLFVLTMFSTFFAGTTGWEPYRFGDNPIALRRTILENWDTGLIYMVCLLGLLFAHEMGHFIATVLYGIPASFPYFLPLPITPIGTLGAVIRMDNREANRRQMFDIGIAGPLAGLVVIIPILMIGISKLDLTDAAVAPRGSLELELPLGPRLLMQWLSPPGYEAQRSISIGQVNPFFMAGWVGVLVTALNMMPVSQLDGGHVTYCLFGRRAHWIARVFMVGLIGYMLYYREFQMSLMVILILLIGVDHPPTSNDRMPLGTARWIIGVASLIIPVLCLTPTPLSPR